MTSLDVAELAQQAAKALAYYAVLVLMMRLAGKRLAGQTTTFDLLVLITLGATLQSALVGKGLWHTAVFVTVVFAAHRTLALICQRSTFVRHLVRGKPRALVVDGKAIDAALEAEGVSPDELLAGLRRLGFERPGDVRLAVLEETGHISAVGTDHGAATPPGGGERDSPKL